MDNKKKNEIAALSIVILVSLVGFSLIYWFYLIITPTESNFLLNRSDLTIKSDTLDKVTTKDSNAPFILEEGEFGRENPFQSVK